MRESAGEQVMASIARPEHNALVLSAVGSAWLLDYLQAPVQEPAPSLLQAARLYRELIRGEDIDEGGESGVGGPRPEGRG